MIKCGIYGIQNLNNNKWYIGQSVNLRKRKNAHWCYFRRGNHINEHLQRSFVLNGERMVFFILEECPRESLDAKEIAWISDLNSIDVGFGYNKKTGGESRNQMSEETKEKMRIAQTGKTIPPEVRAKMSKAAMGRIVSAETREKNRVANRSHVISPDGIRRKSEKMKIIMADPEKRKIAAGALKRYWMLKNMKRLCCETGCA